MHSKVILKDHNRFSNLSRGWFEWWCCFGFSSWILFYYSSKIWYQYHQHCLSCNLWKLPFVTSVWQTHFPREWSWYLFYHDTATAGNELHHPWPCSFFNWFLRGHPSSPRYVWEWGSQRPLAQSLISSSRNIWVMIDAIGNGYEEFRAMIYGEHPGRYWSGLPEKAHFMAIGHFSSHD